MLNKLYNAYHHILELIRLKKIGEREIQTNWNSKKIVKKNLVWVSWRRMCREKGELYTTILKYKKK